jgi:division/cell wall cluster transcriptional repressor MraZ
VFLGTHTPRLDDKGRLFLPAKYREELSAGLVLTKGQERCLYVFPETEFARITEALRTAPVTAKAVRDYSRVFFASASDEIPDKQGRITIPPGLRAFLSKSLRKPQAQFGLAQSPAHKNSIAWLGATPRHGPSAPYFADYTNIDHHPVGPRRVPARQGALQLSRRPHQSLQKA